MHVIKKLRDNLQSVFKEKNYKAVPKLIVPGILTLVPMLASIVFASVWGAGNETKASRYGRAESINEILYSQHQFAELTDEQEKQVEDIAKGIYLSPKEQKKASKVANMLAINEMDDYRNFVDYSQYIH